MFRCARCQNHIEELGELVVTETRKVNYRIGDRTTLGSEILKEQRVCAACKEVMDPPKEVGEVDRVIYVKPVKKLFDRSMRGGAE